MAIVGLVLIPIACSRPARPDGSSTEGLSIFATRFTYSESIPVNQSQVLPPYGMRVRADSALLTLQVSTSTDDPEGKFRDIQDALAEISRLASDSEAVELESVSLTQVGAGSVSRETPAPFVDNLDTSAVTIRLTTDLPAGTDSLIESLPTFNDFLKSISLPETISIRVVSLEAVIQEPEAYREELIAGVYQELEAVKDEYGDSVVFEVTGLHAMPLVMRLSDMEFYIYIEPAIVVKEF
jgi:hypothetical protein